MDMSKNTILEVKDLCKTYIINKRQNNVLRNVSFHIDKGEMVAVMGPSGSGKSLSVELTVISPENRASSASSVPPFLPKTSVNGTGSFVPNLNVYASI